MVEEDIMMARAIAECVKKCGGSTYYVGGFTHDRLIGKDNKEVDVEVHGISLILLIEQKIRSELAKKFYEYEHGPDGKLVFNEDWAIYYLKI